MTQTQRLTRSINDRVLAGVVGGIAHRFGWNPTLFPSRREHNRVRAAGQLALARAVLARRGEAEALVARVFSRAYSG